MDYVLDNTLDNDAIKIDKQNNKIYLGNDIYHWLNKKIEQISEPEPIIKRKKYETSRVLRNRELLKKVGRG